MKKILAIALAAMMLLATIGMFASCGKTAEPVNNDPAEQTDEPTTQPVKVVLGFDADFPPYGYVDEAGEYVGFDIEYAKKVCGNLGYELTLTPIDWDAKDTLLESGAIDFIWNGFTYEGREDGYEWTERYLNNSIVALTTDASIQTLADLAGKAVAVQSDSSGEAAINDEENAELKASFASVATEAQYVTACEKLEAGAYDAVIVDFGVAKYLQSKNSNLIIVAEAVAQETYAVGFKKGNTELCKAINDELVKVGKDAAFIQGLCEKYGVEYEAFLLK